MNESYLEAMVHQIAVICRAAEKEQIRPDVLNQIIQSYMLSVITAASMNDQVYNARELGGNMEMIIKIVAMICLTAVFVSVFSVIKIALKALITEMENIKND